jgi:hypothetical protein
VWIFGVVSDVDMGHAGQTGFFLLPIEVEVSSPGELPNPASARKLAHCLAVACALWMECEDQWLWSQVGSSVE